MEYVSYGYIHNIIPSHPKVSQTKWIKSIVIHRKRYMKVLYARSKVNSIVWKIQWFKHSFISIRYTLCLWSGWDRIHGNKCILYLYSNIMLHSLALIRCMGFSFFFGKNKRIFKEKRNKSVIINFRQSTNKKEEYNILLNWVATRISLRLSAIHIFLLKRKLFVIFPRRSQKEEDKK